MIKFFREKTVQKRIFIGLALLIIPSFIISGLIMGHENQKSDPGSLGMIGSRSISFQKYLSSYQAAVRQLNLVYGPEASKISRYVNLKGEAWDRLLLLDYAKANHIQASDSEVVKWIGEQPAFNGEKGFDERFYKMFVTEHLRLTPRAFEEEMRDTLTIQKIRTKLRDHASVSDDELKSLYNQENGQKELAAAFLSGESEKAGLTSPTDDELKQLYPIMQGNFQEPSKVKVSFLFVPKEKTDSLKAAFDDKGSLQDLAKKYSLTPVETDYFSAADAVPQIGPVREVLEEAFNLKKDEESGWIQTDRGAYKLKAVDLREGHVPTFEEGKARLMEVYVSQLAAQAAAAKLEKLEEAFKADFEKAIKDNNLQAKKAEELGVGAKRLADVTKTLKQGDVSEPFPVRGGAAVVKVIRESPADAQKFEAEKKEFKEKMLDRKSGEEFETLLESLRKTRLKVNLESMRKLFPEDKSPV